MSRPADLVLAILLTTPAVSAVAQDRPAPVAGEVVIGGTVRQGQRIFVTEKSGVQTEGRFLRASPQEVALRVDGTERVFSSQDIGRIEKRDPLWNGMLIGAVPVALIGGVAAGANCSPHCGREVSLGILLGGAIDAAIETTLLSRAHSFRLGTRSGVLSPFNRSTSSGCASDRGETIEVTTRGGETVSGKFIQVSNTSTILTAGGDRREIPSSTVVRITRTGNHNRSGAIAGGVFLAAMTLLGEASCRSGCGDTALAALFLGGAGALCGGAIGAAIPKHAVIYQPGSDSSVRVMPVVGPGRAAVVFSARF